VKYLLDTNVLSEIRKKRAHRGVQQWFSSVHGDDLFLSVLVIGEIKRGILMLRRRDEKQADGYENWLWQLSNHYADRLLPVTVEVAEMWATLNVPDPVPVIDGLMAATARVHDLTLVTRNTADLERTGVRLLNPWEA
jgi:predicted nucleic acid-binding protein